MKRLVVIAMILLSGCSTSQFAKELIGMSAKDVVDSKNKRVKIFEKSPEACFSEMAAAISVMGASITQKDPREHFLAANRFESMFKFCIDTTDVGIVVRPLAANRSEVIVASDSSYLAEAVAALLFKRLGPPDTMPVEAPPAAQKTDPVK